MANTFINLPLSGITGPGPAIATSTLVADKTVIIEAANPGKIAIEGSHDGTNFAPVLTYDLLQDPKQQFIYGVFSHMRVNRIAGSGAVAVNVGAEVTSDNTFDVIPFPTGAGDFGTPIDSSTMGPVKTFVVSGPHTGAIAVLGSNDSISYDPMLNFESSGSDTLNALGVYSRLRIQRLRSLGTPFPTVTVGAGPGSVGSGTSGPQGNQGGPGGTGSQGTQGSSSTGAQGNSGTSGPQGAQGAQGSPSGGSQGPQGDQGDGGEDPGPPGDDGPPGNNGLTPTNTWQLFFSGRIFTNPESEVTVSLPNMGTFILTSSFGGYPVGGFPTRTFSQLRVKPHVNTLGEISTVTVRKNGVDTLITVSIPAGSTVLVSDLVNTDSFTSTDILDVVLEAPIDLLSGELSIAVTLVGDFP